MPQPRPGGVGLGFDEVWSSSSVSNKEGEELRVIIGAHVQIIYGSHRGQYGQVRLLPTTFPVSNN
jgi:hypothetical protein